VVYHLGGGTLSAQKAKKTYLNFRNNLTVIFKNDYSGGLAKKIFNRMFLDGLAAFSFVFSRGPAHFFAVIRAHHYFWTHLGSIRKKRKYWMDKAEIPNRTGIYKGSIVMDYFFRDKRVFGALPSHSIHRQSRRS
jgi:hypothetical protein